MSIKYYGSDGLVYELGDNSVLMHYNHNHDALGRFASSNTAKTISKNERLITANRDISQTWDKYAKSYEKKAAKYDRKINKKKAKNKDVSKYEEKLSKIKQEGKKYAEYKSNAEMYAIQLEKENQKKGKKFSELVENSVFSSIQRDSLNRITNVEYNIKTSNDIETAGKFNRDLMTGKANSMTDEQILKKYRTKKTNDFVKDYSKIDFGSESDRDINAYSKLQKEIEQKSVDWYNSKPKTERTKAVYEKYKDKDIHNGLSPDKEKFEDELAGAVLKDLGYKNTPEARKRIRQSGAIIWD